MTTSGGDAYTATIPGAAAGHLIRYRVEATNAAGTTTRRAWTTARRTRASSWPTASRSAIPVLEWFIADADYNLITAEPDDRHHPAGACSPTTASVFDNSTFSIRGESTQTTPRSSWKVELPQNHDLSSPALVEPVDEFAMNADWSDSSHGRPTAGLGLLRRRPASSNEQVIPDAGRSATPRSRACTPTSTSSTGPGATARATRTSSSSRPGTAPSTPDRQLVEYRFEKKNPDDEDFTDAVGVPQSAST